MLAICTLSHGNADPERGFSINKFLLSIHGASTSEKTIQAVRFVKDYINLNGGERNFPVSTKLIKESRFACQKWKEDLRLEREMKEKEELSKQQEEAKKNAEKEKKEEKEKVSSDIETIRNGIKVANDLLNTGQSELEKLTESLLIDKVKLMSANAQISAGIKRKNELEKELDYLNAKLQEWIFILFLFC